MNTLTALLAAMNRGEIKDVTAYVDNDQVLFYESGGDDDVLDLHPSEVIEQALLALNIKVEQV